MKLQEIKDFVKELRGLSQEELAKKVGYKDRSSIAKIEAGEVDLSQSKIVDLANALNTTPGALMGWEDEPEEKESTKLHIKNIADILEIQTQKIPLIGTIACGVPNLSEEFFEGYVEIGTDVRCDFALRCSGDSMINARIMDGDIVFIRKQHTVNDGEIAAVIIDGEATLKRVYFSEGYITLQAENPTVKPIIVPLDEDSQIEVRIIGKAVAFQSDVR